MRKGDLVQVRPGCGDEGRIGVLMNDAEIPFTHCMVLLPDGMMEINRYWLDVLDAHARGDVGDMISVPKEA